MIPVILCGGTGSRLWPVSRDGHPKPFMRLPGGGSLLRETVLRAARIPGAGQPLAVAHRELSFQLLDELRAAGVTGAPCCLLEPERRGTAPAVAAAALQAARIHGTGVPILVLPADHLVDDASAWLEAVAAGRELALQGRIAVFGVVPTRAETGYGYIEAEGGEVARFIEKPGAAQAADFIASGRFLWNAGMVCATPAAILRELALHCPALLDAVRESLEGAPAAAAGGPAFIELAPGPFARVPDISFDVAVLEKMQGLAVVRCAAAMGWSDAGTWAEVGALVPPDGEGNRVDGDALLLDTRGCQVRSGGRLVAMLGLDNLLVVDTPDALLIADRTRGGDVRQVHARLREQGHAAARIHRAVHRPWGVYTVLAEGPRYKVKHLSVKPGASLSLQAHAHRSEHWVVLQGTAEVVKDGEVRTFAAGESASIPAGCRHRLSNPSAEELQMIEVQTGSYVGEDDIVRFADVYGRR